MEHSNSIKSENATSEIHDVIDDLAHLEVEGGGVIGISLLLLLDRFGIFCYTSNEPEFGSP